MQIQQLLDDQLLTATKSLVQSERETLTKVLRHLREIDRRRLYCDLAYQSLFEYAVKELKYSESQASRRLNAMRLIQEIPQVESSITKGELSLSNISQAQSMFRQQDKLSPDRRTSKASKLKVLDALKNKSTREGQRMLLELNPNSIDPRSYDRERQVTPDSIEIKFLMNDQLKAKFIEVKSLLGPKAVGMSYGELFTVMADLSTEKLAEKKFGKKRLAEQNAKTIKPEQLRRGRAKTSNQDLSQAKLAPRSAEAKTSVMVLPAPAPELVKEIKTGTYKNPRYLPKVLIHAIWQRDGRRCCLCRSKTNLNIDHVRPLALGGKTELNNLRLLCFSCNQRQAIKSFGLPMMNKFRKTR